MAADMCIAIDGVIARHGTRVAAAIDGVHIAMQQDDVGQHRQVAHIVATIDGANMVAVVCTNVLHIDKHFNKIIY